MKRHKNTIYIDERQFGYEGSRIRKKKKNEFEQTLWRIEKYLKFRRVQIYTL